MPLNQVTIAGRTFRLNSLKTIGKGGEADIYELGTGDILKVFKTPDHADYENNPHEQKGAAERILAHQKKLLKFPKGLPDRVVAPQELALSPKGDVAGYTMKFVRGGELMIRYSERSFRSGGIRNGNVVNVFRDLHQTVSGIHSKSVVIGDFNDLNEFVLGDKVFIIDADSFQYDKFFCLTFTQKFVDPLLCDPNEKVPMLVKPHNPNSDWYAFAVMLMQSLLYVGPYGGIYRPKGAGKKISHDSRSLHRITVFDPDVMYPKPAAHWSVLTDELLHHFHKVFKKDERKEFPVALLERFQWKECPKCGIEYARSGCPVCDPALGGVVKERIVTTVHGKVTVTFVKKTSGTIVYATYQKGRGMQYLVFERKEFKRESDEVVYRGDIDPQVRYRISGKKTMFGKHEQMLILEGGKQTQNISVSSTVSVPCFDANDKHVYWAQGEQLVRDGDFGTSEFIGNILGGQTRFWVGTTFGFGFYTAGLVRVNFVFDALHRGLNDTVKLPPIRGQMIDARCYFADGQCWFLWTSQEVGVRKNNCVVIKKDGTVLAYAEAPEGDDSWLGTIGAKCATGPVLLAATDEGIVQVKVDGSTIVEAQKFPETEPYVDTGCSLFVGDGGLYVVTRQEILHLKIQP